MRFEFLILSAIFVPLLGALLLSVVGYVSTRLRNYLSLALILVSLVCSLKLIPLILSGQAMAIEGRMMLGFSFSFVADGLAVFMACTSSFISAIIALYSFSYISHYENQNEYYAMIVLFVGAMMGLVFSRSLVLLFIFWEITAITSWRLIGFFRERSFVVKADKAFLVTVFGALMMLLGFVMIYQQTGSFDLAVIKQQAAITPIPDIAVALILIGILSKSATLPFHTWLPDAGVAPSPVTAFLHAAVLVKIGVYVFARLFLATFTLSQIWYTVVPVVAAASALVSAAAALLETDLKRIIAYSTVSQIGFIFFGLATGSRVGVEGAVLFILMHGIAKAGLFLCAGIIEQNTKIRDITKLGGLIRTMPVTAMSFLFCAFSVMGLPPFGGFFSKYLVFAGAIKGGQMAAGFVFLAGAFLTILYLLRLFNMVFMGEAHQVSPKEGSVSMVACVAALAVFSLIGGILVAYPAGFIHIVVRPMLGVL
jgi:proton-translocating NADH-quinone oxidoreductase chain N